MTTILIVELKHWNSRKCLASQKIGGLTVNDYTPVDLQLLNKWRRLAEVSDEEISLAEAALFISAIDHPELDLASCLEQIDEIAHVIRKKFRGDTSVPEKLMALNHYLFAVLGFRGNVEEYTDPKNSFLDQVLIRRLGIPITLSIVYLEIGRRLGLKMYGIAFPSHFLVKCVVNDNIVIIDVFNRGITLSLEDLKDRLRSIGDISSVSDGMLSHLLSAATNRNILARILRNLLKIYSHNKDWIRALSVSDFIITLLSDDADEAYRDRASIYLKLDCHKAALSDLRTYLHICPGAPDADDIKETLFALEQSVSKLN